MIWLAELSTKWCVPMVLLPSSDDFELNVVIDGDLGGGSRCSPFAFAFKLNQKINTGSRSAASFFDAAKRIWTDE